MSYDPTDRPRPTGAGAGEPTPPELTTQRAAAGDDQTNDQVNGQDHDQALERDVAAALSFFRWADDDEDPTPLSDAHAEFALRMSDDLDVSADRVERMHEGVFGSRSADAPGADAPRADAPRTDAGVPAPSGAPAEGATFVRDAVPDGGVRSGAPPHVAARHPAHLSLVTDAASSPAAPRPNFGRRCREMKRKVSEVARELRVNDEVLLALEQGHARSVPRAFLAAAAAFVDFDALTLARCFAPNTGDVARMAAHDPSGRGPSTPAPSDDFLTIVEQSELSEADKQYWRAVVRAEDAEAAEAGDA